MATYKPLFMYVAPASIPQIVAHIQKYLEENPIISDPDAIEQAISDYIAEHPELIAVASVNGKTGSVVLTGADININATTEVTIATQIANLAAMIADAGGDIDTIKDNIEDIYTELDGTEGIKARLTAVETDINDDTNGVKVRLSGIEGEVNGAGGIDSRLTTVENDINEAQTGIKSRLTNAETDISSLQTRMTQAEADIDSNESNIETLNTNLNTSLAEINSNIMYTRSCHPVAGSPTTIPAENSIDVNMDMSAFPAGFNRKAVIMSYGGNPKVVFTHYLGTQGNLQVTLYNPSSAAITYNINTCTFIVFYTL